MSSGTHAKAETLPVRVMVPESGLDAMTAAAASLIDGFGKARSLAWRFFLRDTRAEHRQSALGYVWLVVPPLVNALVWIFLNDQNVITIDSRGVPYPVFVLTGTVLWTAFNTAVMGMLGVVGGARSFLGKVNFPHESLVYASALKSLMDAAIASLIILPALLLFRVDVGPQALLFPIAIAASLILGWASGLLLVPVAALYTDVSRAIQLVLRFAFFLTPVIFPIPHSGPARAVMMLNPVTPVVTTGRAWLTGSGEAMQTPFMIVFAVSSLVFVGVLILYKMILPHLVERLST